MSARLSVRDTWSKCRTLSVDLSALSSRAAGTGAGAAVAVAWGNAARTAAGRRRPEPADSTGGAGDASGVSVVRKNGRGMAQEPAAALDIIQQFGPHLAYAEGQRLDRGIEPDRTVKTHCCFCGQQCGIQLKVKDNEVIGFEPWEEFPFNRGMLCPKGVKRYLQGSHPDRLLHAYARDPAAAGGFREMAYEE